MCIRFGQFDGSRSCQHGAVRLGQVMEGITLEELQDKLRKGNLKESEIKIATAGQQKDYPKGIPECGADALRFGLLAYTVQGRDGAMHIGDTDHGDDRRHDLIRSDHGGLGDDDDDDDDGDDDPTYFRFLMAPNLNFRCCCCSQPERKQGCCLPQLLQQDLASH